MATLPQQQSAHGTAVPDFSDSTSGAQAAGGGGQHLRESPDVCLATASSEEKGQQDGHITGQIAGYSWQLPAGVTQDECIMLWVGPETVPTLTHLHLTFNK